MNIKQTSKDKIIWEIYEGRCRECRGVHKLTKRGNIPSHYGFTAQGRSALPCNGSHKEPEEVLRVKPERPMLPKTIVISGKAQLYAALQDVDLTTVKALYSSYKDAKKEGLSHVTSDQLWQQNALVLATKGHAFR